MTLRNKIDVNSLGNNQAEEVKLSNVKGKQTTIIVGKNKKTLTFSEAILDNFMINNNQSVHGMRQTCALIRKRAGRHSVPKNYATHITKKANRLDCFYHKRI